jgi:hypothetical protein
LHNPQELRAGLYEIADENENFAESKFSWIAWPERHFIIPVKKLYYDLQGKIFNLVLDYTPGKLERNPNEPDLPPKFIRKELPKPFSYPAVRGTPEGKAGLHEIYVGLSPDIFLQKIVWLIPEDETVKDGGTPEKRLQFRGDIIGPIEYSEKPASMLTDMSGPCEATMRLQVDGRIGVYGAWKAPVEPEKAEQPEQKKSLGILDIIDVGLALGGLAIKAMAQSAADDAALSKKIGQLESSESCPVLFDKVVRFIRSNPLGPGIRGQVQADPSVLSIMITYQWIEPNLSLSLPDMPQRLDLYLTFQPTSTGTSIIYEWVDNNFPAGLKVIQNIRIINSWIRNLARQ